MASHDLEKQREILLEIIDILKGEQLSNKDDKEIVDIIELILEKHSGGEYVSYERMVQFYETMKNIYEKIKKPITDEELEKRINALRS